VLLIIYINVISIFYVMRECRLFICNWNRF